MKVILENFGKIFEKVKKNGCLLALVLLGAALLLVPGRHDAKGAAKDAASASETPEFSLADEQKRMEDALSQTKGAGKVTLVLTLKTSSERIIAQDTKESVRAGGDERETDKSVSAVTVSSGSSGKDTVTLKFIYPEYAGALVVAEGAGSADVQLRLTSAVSSLTGLRADQITVIRMKEQ